MKAVAHATGEDIRLRPLAVELDEKPILTHCFERPA